MLGLALVLSLPAALLDAVGPPLLLLDLRAAPEGHPLHQPRWARPLSMTHGLARWPRHVDGRVLVRSTTPEDG